MKTLLRTITTEDRLNELGLKPRINKIFRRLYMVPHESQDV